MYFEKAAEDDENWSKHKPKEKDESAPTGFAALRLTSFSASEVKQFTNDPPASFHYLHEFREFSSRCLWSCEHNSDHII